MTENLQGTPGITHINKFNLVFPSHNIAAYLASHATTFTEQHACFSIFLLTSTSTRLFCVHKPKKNPPSSTVNHICATPERKLSSKVKASNIKHSVL